MFAGAADFYRSIGMLEETVECYTSAGRSDQALDIITSLSDDNRKTPRILCILGDIHKDEEYYNLAL